MKDRGLLTGYFGMLAKNIYGRTRVKNSEILELLIYGAYIEEQSKLESIELNMLKDVVNHYYQQGQEEVNQTLNKKKQVSVIPDAIFWALLDMPNSKGYIWKQYVEAIIKYNADQIYRQCIINIQQDKENNIDDDVFQNIIKKQQNSKLCINGDKISGDVDLTSIGLNNQAKMQGIYSFDEKAKCKFVAVEDESTTKECHSLNRQEFFIHDWNEFWRYSKANRSLVKYRCYGLVAGLNLPPINDGFHWCRSTIIYLPPIAKQGKIKYNDLDIPKISKDVKPLLKDYKLNHNVKKLFDKYLTSENVIIDNNNSKPMYYSVEDDKIIINPKHHEFQYYDLQESLAHEIIHMIDNRKGIVLSNHNFIETQINLAEIEIMKHKDRYNELFINNRNYEENMTISDIFSAVTNNKIRGAFYHDSSKWNNHSIKYSEVVSNIMTAEITNNKYSLKLIREIKPLNRIKERLMKEYEII